MKVDRPTGPVGPKELEGGVERSGEPTESFASKLHGAQPPVAATEPGPIEGIEALVARLRAGEITMEGLLDSLVERTAASSPLGPRGREELRSILKAALDSDPTLRRLTRAIEQG